VKALQISGLRKTTVVDIPEPVLGPDEVLLKIGKVGICGSDLSTFLGKNPLVEFPRIPGHEIAATIVESGENVPAKLQRDRDVTVVPYTNCGRCSSCIRGRFNCCRNNQTLGIQRDGAVTEYIAVPWQKIVEARGLTANRLILVEPLSVGFHAVNRGGITDADTVMVIGCGMIGIGAIVRASLRGAKVIAVDIDDTKLNSAQSMGCSHTINSATRDLSSELAELTDGSGPDVVVEAAGNPLTYRTAIESVAFSGRVICIGYAKEDATLPTHMFVQKELDIYGSRNATALDFISVRNYISDTDHPVDDLITNEFTLPQAQEAFQYWADNPGKVIKIVARL
jgi:threonine dehydrogenase-like Zn-dependent dehydrogenase